MNTGEKFLHPPEEKLVTDDLQRLAESAVEAMEQAFRTNLRQEERDHILWTEAIHSAAIEDENNPERIEKHQHALAEFLAKPLTPNSLLEMHRRMMAGQSHASPGRYRSIEIIIGEYHPPRSEFIPSLMDELFTFMGENGNNQIARATWAHVEFESIHPFADGNGRTGRALLMHILGVPISISRFIYSERSTYYHLFRKSDWPSWLEWMAEGILIESNMHL